MIKAMATSLILISQATPAAAEAPPGRVVNVTVYGGDPCPKGSADEVVVCARRPDNERYRIPKELRRREQKPSETSWAARERVLEEAGRPSMPGSCSAVGMWGQSGCFNQLVRQWRAAREAARSEAASRP